MAESCLLCAKCQSPLPGTAVNSMATERCPYCGAEFQVLIFPALVRSAREGRPGETVMAEGESTCFYHPDKRAETPCERCGRFLCALCDIEIDGEHVCPNCISTGKSKGRFARLVNKNIRYDKIVSALAFWPLALFACAPYMMILTAPAAIIMSAFWWKKTTTPVGRPKLRMAVAAGFACIEFLASAAFLGFFIWGVYYDIVGSD